MAVACSSLYVCVCVCAFVHVCVICGSTGVLCCGPVQARKLRDSGTLGMSVFQLNYGGGS